MPSINTGQNYAPWLNDDVNDLVQSQWSAINNQYIDVTLTLNSRTNVSRLSLYDYQGIFTSTPVSIYALNGTQRTLLGIFTGDQYMQWVDITVATPVAADAIIVHKYGNDIPQKIKVFGTAPTTTLAQSVIAFSALPAKTVGDAPFALAATSNNTASPITYTSSNPAVASVSNATGSWLTTVNALGTATITASQAGNTAYLAATNVAQTLTVQPAAAGSTSGTTGNGKIPIEPQRWYQLSTGADGIAQLFDGDLANSISVRWDKLISPTDAIYPLRDGETFAIERVKFYDGQGSCTGTPMTLSVITNSWQRVQIGTFTGEQYNTWGGPYPSRPGVFQLDNIVRDARYLVLTAAQGYPTEIEFYGSYTIPAAVPTVSAEALASQKQVKLKQSFGVNAFEWDVLSQTQPGVIDATRMTAVKNFSGIRHYLDWERLEWNEGGYTFNPSGRGGWNYDTMYEELKREGVEVLVCLKDMPPWMQATYPASERAGDNVPVRYGRNFLTPASYLEMSKVAFQFVARYGSNPNVNRSLLSVSTATNWVGEPVNQVKVGLGLIKYIECDNERDKWWNGRKAHQTAPEYAAQLSAFYDGHLGSMGAGVGVKNADPTIQVVMAGLANPTPDYVRGMIEWCRQYRGYKADGSVNLCWDVINYHLYSNDASSSQSGTSTRGAAPEVSNAGAIAKAFVQMAHQYANDMPVWITETGYDLNQGSPLKAVAIGNRSALETQGDWTLRTALAYARWGVERVFSYQLYDDNPTSTIKFGSMGLINSDKTPRPAAQFLSQANQLIGEYSYKQTLSSDPVVDRYELNGKSAYVLVVPDERGRTAAYTLNLGSAAYADVYRPTVGSTSMAVQRVALQGGQLSIQVTETPVFVLPGTFSAPQASTSTCSATGTILREEWANVGGDFVVNIPLQTTPSSTSQLTQMATNIASSNNYGARIRGYVCPPQSGAYTFFVVGDDQAELWLSSDDNPANKTRVASCSVWTPSPFAWTQSAAQQSAPVQLVAGRRYYLEALHKQGWGNGYVSVAWQLPSGTLEGPIPSSRLSPFVPTANRGTGSTTKADTTQTTAAKAGFEKATLSAAPNPFANESTVRFRVVAPGPASLMLYDLRGQLVRQLFAGTLEAGVEKEVSVRADGLATGIYDIRLVTNASVLHHRVVVAR